MAHPLVLTGERTLPDAAGEQYWFTRHEAAYLWVASQFVDSTATTVVDAGCGEGYGAELLRAAGAQRVVALEYDASTVIHAAREYPTVWTVRANLVALPLRDATADLVVALQVVEHLWDLPAFLRECRRALRPGGTLVLTTPNRTVFSPRLGRGERPTNPFHVEEFDAAQLADLLRDSGFEAPKLEGLQHGERLAAWEREHGVGLVEAQLGLLAGVEDVSGDTAAFVATCTAADFVVGGSDGAQDLLAWAARP